MHALQSLGEQLVKLNREQFARVDVPDELREAVDFAHRVTQHEARRRHMQYIGKLMRQVDADRIRAELDRLTGESRTAVALMHRAESWRDRLLGDDEALTAFLAEHPQADAQWLRNTIRSARRESPPIPKHTRELYRALHQMLEDESRERTAHDES
jgi:ribosome-associated protein